jgi:putative transposase
MAAGPEHVTRAVVFTLDPSPAQVGMLRNYLGAVRFGFNWALGQAKTNLEVRAAERDAGVAEDRLTPAVSWSKFSLRKQFNGCKAEVAPWAGEVAKHCFDTGIGQAADALKNWSDAKHGRRKGPMGFPRFRSKRRPMQSVSFVELNHQLSWLHESRHAVRLMLPQALIQSKDPLVRARARLLVWVHTVESTRRLFRLVEDGRATIQKVTFSYRGGRWQVSFQIRYQLAHAPTPKPHRQIGDVVGVDLGVKHLATLSQPVPGVTDEAGHVPNPQVLQQHLRRLRRLDRQIARCQPGSKNRAELVARRARLHGQVTKTRQLHLHALANVLAGGFDVVGVEDLHVQGMSNRQRRLGRALADASLAELRRILTYKTADHGHHLVVVDRFYPSSKTCSACHAVKAKLPLHVRTFDCDHCGLSLDRDVNAAHNIAREADRLTGLSSPNGNVAGLRPETRNAASRLWKTDQGDLTATADPSTHRTEAVETRAEPRDQLLLV